MAAFAVSIWVWVGFLLSSLIGSAAARRYLEMARRCLLYLPFLCHIVLRPLRLPEFLMTLIRSVALLATIRVFAKDLNLHG